MRFEKHVHVLNMINRIRRESTAFSDTVDRELCYQFGNRVLDELIDYQFAHWPIPDSVEINGRRSIDIDRENIKLCDAMLNMRQEEFEEKMETLPPFFTEYIFPIAAVRYLFRELQLCINHRTSRNFEEFERRYGGVVLGF